MIKSLQLRVLPSVACNYSDLQQYCANMLSINTEDISGIQKIKQSIDARSKQVVYQLEVIVFINEPSQHYQLPVFRFKQVDNKSKRVVIVGAGPAGLFAALKLLEQGIKPIILERGKDVKNRRRDLAAITKQGIVNAESNYCFGEGGAGTYSDGKLYTRSTKRGDVERILQLFVHHGAGEHILYEAHPHIGTNKLPQIIENIRTTILQYGGEIHFNSKVTRLLTEKNFCNGVVLADGENIKADAVILATGHSARDIFSLLQQQKIHIEPKPFALGVRIEHPQNIIDSIQYHCSIRDENLPPAAYSMVHQAQGRGVFSFCMCPGGIIAPAMTNSGEIVVNGWSPSRRNNPFANSGMVVSIEAVDFKPYEKHGVLAAMYFQQAVEQQCFNAGGKNLQAPAQRLTDFVQHKTSSTLPNCSYYNGVASINLHEVLPSFVSNRLQEALVVFGKKMRGYYTEEAIMVATESRTSSPVKIPRYKDTLQHVQIKNLYPCGEGAGYAGGIVSAAIDGERCAEAFSKL